MSDVDNNSNSADSTNTNTRSNGSLLWSIRKELPDIMHLSATSRRSEISDTISEFVGVVLKHDASFTEAIALFKQRLSGDFKIKVEARPNFDKISSVDDLIREVIGIIKVDPMYDMVQALNNLHNCDTIPQIYDALEALKEVGFNDAQRVAMLIQSKIVDSTIKTIVEASSAISSHPSDQRFCRIHSWGNHGTSSCNTLKPGRNNDYKNSNRYQTSYRGRNNNRNYDRRHDYKRYHDDRDDYSSVKRNNSTEDIKKSNPKPVEAWENLR